METSETAIPPSVHDHRRHNNLPELPYEIKLAESLAALTATKRKYEKKIVDKAAVLGTRETEPASHITAVSAKINLGNKRTYRQPIRRLRLWRAASK